MYSTMYVNTGQLRVPMTAILFGISSSWELNLFSSSLYPRDGCHANPVLVPVYVLFNNVLFLFLQVNDSNGGILSPEDAWRSLRSAACSSVLPPCSTLGLTVLDPRLGLPGIRTSIDALVTGQKTGVYIQDHRLL